jgi:hypothetical protein
MSKVGVFQNEMVLYKEEIAQVFDSEYALQGDLDGKGLPGVQVRCS